MDVIIATAIIAAVVGLAIGIGAGYFVRKNISEAKIGEADSLAKNIIDQANKDAETIKKAIVKKYDCFFAYFCI